MKKTLIETLKEQTQSLKEQYIEKTKDWANTHFDFCEKQIVEYYKLNSKNCEKFNNRFKDLANWNQKEFENSVDYRREKTLLAEYFWEYNRVTKKGKEKYIESEIRKAKDHYENSIIKLAERIQKKNLNENKLEIKTSHIGVNIETTFTDGKQIVKAWTIIAEGEVQKPHYRYLVK